MRFEEPDITEGRVNVPNLAIRVAQGAAEALAAGHGLPGAGPVVEALVRDLLQVQDEQAQTLSRIDENVQRLLDGPWRTARLYLNESLLPGRSAKQVQAALRQAAEHLRQALGLQSPRSFGAAFVAFDLAVVLAALGDHDASRLYVRTAITAATDEVIDFYEGIHNQVMAEVDSPLKRLRGSLARPKPRRPGVHWYFFAIAIEPLCGKQLLISEQYRMGSITFILFRQQLDRLPETRGLPRPDWLQGKS